MSVRLTLRRFLGRLLTSHGLLEGQRRWRERVRRLRGRPQEVHVFLQLDDPYSLLLVQRLQSFLRHTTTKWTFHLAPPPPGWATPARTQATEFALRDAYEIAPFEDLWCPPKAPPAALLERGQRASVRAIQEAPHALASIFRGYWEGDASALQAFPTVSKEEMRTHLSQSAKQRARMGHYLSATLWMGGEWYCGLDRLPFLESRLRAWGGFQDPTIPALSPRREVQGLDITLGKDAPPLECFFSLRSPYSYLALPRLFSLAKETGVRLVLRPVLPMVSRGLKVPWLKRKVIVQDCAREARRLGLPFGDICDPLGAGVERGLSLFVLAREKDLLAPTLLSFTEAVWARGVNAATDRGLRQIAETAGLNWEQVLPALQAAEWREETERNRAHLRELGLWGVPCFRWGSWSTWGQDRLWLVEQTLWNASRRMP